MRLHTRLAKTLFERFRSKDAYREALNSIALGDGCIAVTDTHKCVIVGERTGPVTPTDPLSARMELSRSAIYGDDFDTDAVAKASSPFPDLDRVFKHDLQRRFAINPKYLKDIADLALATGADTPAVYICLTDNHAPGTPVGFECAVPKDHPRITGLVMPMNVSLETTSAHFDSVKESAA